MRYLHEKRKTGSLADTVTLAYGPVPKYVEYIAFNCDGLVNSIESIWVNLKSSKQLV